MDADLKLKSKNVLFVILIFSVIFAIAAKQIMLFEIYFLMY